MVRHCQLIVCFFKNYLCIPDITVNDHVVTALDAPDIMRLTNSFFALPA